jgi:hypothetical protein
VKNGFINYCSEKNDVLEKILILISIPRMFTNSGLDFSHIDKSNSCTSTGAANSFQTWGKTKSITGRI